MLLLFLRCLPFLVGGLNAALIVLQARAPESYPWLAAWTPVSLLAAGLFIARRRMPAGEALWKLLPPALALASVVYGLLLVEGRWGAAGLPLFTGGVSYISLELLFLLVYLPTRYPVNGLSHLNLSLVPFVVWFAQYTSVGLTVFVHASRVIPIIVLATVTALLFHATSHVETSGIERRRWTALGAWLGLHVGLLGAFLPLNLSVQGSLAAVIVAVVLRARRYGIAPLLSRKLMAVEAIGSGLLLVILTATSRWA